MYKSTILVLCCLFAFAAAKPHFVASPVAYTAPAAAAAAFVPAPYITATSSQVIARNYNGLAVAPVATAAYTATPVVTRYASPFGYASSRLIASPYAASYTAVAPGYAAPLQYAAAAPYLL